MIDTICALSTPHGRAALGVIRISGPGALLAIERMGADKLEPRSPKVCVLRDSGGFIVDECLVTFFKAPNSYTGEDLVEIGAHGNPVIVRKIVDEIVSRETVRLADPGEFTGRALANKKLSLDQVEALGWILNSTSIEGVRRGLHAKLEGLGSSANQVSESFRSLIADLQAQLDFSETEVGTEDRFLIKKSFTGLINQLEGWVKNFESSRHLFESWVVALVGPPNSGKSSLFNRLIGVDKAIVFDQPGTTRDFIEHRTVISGIDVVLVDTAGIRESLDPIEIIGIKKTKEAMRRADLICWVDESGAPPGPELVTEYQDKKWLNVQSKADLRGLGFGGSTIAVSSVTGDGVNEIRAKIVPEETVHTALVPLTSKRQRDIVSAALGHLNSGLAGLESGQYLDMVTEQLLMGARAIRAIVEPPQNDDVLKQIFSRFCIGK